MKKPKTKFPQCPCCLTGKYRTEIQICLSKLEKIERKEFKHYKELQMDTYGSFVDANFEWACDNCLQTKKGILANPGLQQTPWTPHLAYFDTKIKCHTCSTDFLFKKEEKKAWYESYNLPVHAQPDNCLECRRKIRNLKSENKTVSEILKKSDNEITDDELKMVVDIYLSWDKMEKVKFYQAILNKRLNKDDRLH